MVYSTLKEMNEGGYIRCQGETYVGRQRKVYSLTPDGLNGFRAAGRLRPKMLPQVQEAIVRALILAEERRLVGPRHD